MLAYLTSQDHGERYFPNTSYNKNETASLNMSLLAPAVLAAVFEIRRGDGWTCAAVRAEERSRHQIYQRVQFRNWYQRIIYKIT